MVDINVLLMGGSGFLGSQLLRVLHKEFHIFAPKHQELDAMNYDQIQNFIRNHEINIVIHAVANHAGIGTGLNKELYFLESNLIMNFNLVKAAYQNGVAKFITFGTSCCYNNPDQNVFTESDYWKNKSEITYGTCKRVMLEQLQLKDTMRWVYLIPPNLYGPGDHFGEDNAHFIPATVKKFDDAKATMKKHIVVWGDGSQRRDFLYVDDLIQVIKQAMLFSKFDSKIVNVATMTDHCVKDIVMLIRKFLNCEDIDILWDKTKPTGVSRKLLDNKKFLEIMPDFEFTNIQNGIETIAKWHLNGNSFVGL